jgi:serine/threonine-protein kinase HipA
MHLDARFALAGPHILHHDASMNLHLALRTPENWRTVAEVRLDAVASGVSAQVSYDFDYVIERILAVGEGEIGRAAVACGYPVRLEPHVRSHWPRFLDDLMPGGAARRWWVNRLGIADQPPLEQNLRLLSEAAMAPVGHLRVQEAVPPRVGAPLRFPRQAVADRDHGFLDHAAEMGASVGGGRRGRGARRPSCCCGSPTMGRSGWIPGRTVSRPIAPTW